jgi:DNA-binding CsgD family transcriptional regulator
VLPESFSDALRVQALKLLTQLLGRRNDSTRASELATQALALAGDDEQLQAAMELELTYFNAGLGNALAAAGHAQAAVKHAQAAGDDAALAQGLGCLTMLNFIAGRGLDAVQFGRVLALEDPVDAPLVLRPRYFDAVMHLWIGDLDGCLQRFGQLHDETLERGQEGALPMLLLYMVQAQLWKGDLAEAGRLAEEAAEAAALLDDSTTSAVALGAAALVHAYDGNSELAHREALEGLALFERLQWRAGAIWPMWALGLLELSRGEPAAVDRVLGPLSAQVVAIGAGDPSFFVFVPDEIEALVALGELDRAQGYLEPFQRAAVDLDRAWAIAVAERCRGAIAGARGEPQAAFAAFDRALAAHALAGMPFERARTLLVAGMTYRRFKRRGMARELLEEALSVFERLGTPLWAENVRGELARVGGPGGDRDALTETERRLAELAAGGLSNQEVAERAFVTVKTVEANLTRVYRKLGVRSRVALANALRGARAEEPGSHQT